MMMKILTDGPPLQLRKAFIMTLYWMQYRIEIATSTRSSDWNRHRRRIFNLPTINKCFFFSSLHYPRFLLQEVMTHCVSRCLPWCCWWWWWWLNHAALIHTHTIRFSLCHCCCARLLYRVHRSLHISVFRSQQADIDGRKNNPTHSS